MAENWGYQPGGPLLSPHIRAQIERRRARLLEAWRRDPAREVALLAIYVVALVTLYVGAVGLKQYHFLSTVGDDRTSFWMESAQRFRYVRMVAEGGEIPILDRQMQAPDGYPPFSDTVLQELLYGRLFQRFADSEDDVAAYARLLTRLISASSVFPLALLALAVSRRRDASLLAALAWAVALAVAERGTGQALLREDLAVPLLVWHLAALASWSQRPRFATALASGVFLAFALLCWKLVSFYVLMLVGFVASSHWLARARPGMLALGLLGFMVPSLALVPLPLSLQFDRYLTSTPLIAAAALFITLILARIAPRSPRLLWPVLALVLFAVLRVALPRELGYDHAWETLWARLRFLGAKPLDPEVLSFHARHYWTGNYESPTLARLLRDWPPLLLAAAPGGWILCRWWRPESWQRHTAEQRVPAPLPRGLLQGLGPLEPLPPLATHFILWLALSFVGSYLLFRKLQLFAALALVVLLALGFAAVCRRRMLLRSMMAAAVLWAGLQSTDRLPGLHEPLGIGASPRMDPVTVFSADSFSDLARFLADASEPDDTMLASFVISPYLLTYLDRPTALHCFFEGELPERYRRVTEARFGSEQELLQLARQLGVKWYIHEAHHLLRTDPQMSQRYVAGAMDWPAESVLARMHFAPERLQHFELQFENRWFRVFRVVDKGQRPRHRLAREPLATWSRPLFAAMYWDPLDEDGTEEASPCCPSELLYSGLEAERQLQMGLASRQQETPSAPWSERYFQEALRLSPHFYPAADALADLYEALQRPDKAKKYRQKASRLRAFLRRGGELPEELSR